RVGQRVQPRSSDRHDGRPHGHHARARTPASRGRHGSRVDVRRWRHGDGGRARRRVVVDESRWGAAHVWGTAADLIDILDVRPDGDGSYVSVTRGDNSQRPVVEGSQMLAQAIVAAGRHAPGRRTVSAHMVFMRVADANQPLRFDLEDLSAGRTFSTVAVRVTQDGRLIASGTLLLDVISPDVIRHAVEAPDTKGAQDAEP